MKKKIKFLVATLVTTAMMLACLDVPAYAATQKTLHESVIAVNPIYEDVITTEQLQEIFDEQNAENNAADSEYHFGAGTTTYTSMSQLGSYLREQEKNRATQVVVSVSLSDTSPNFLDAINYAEEHTGNPEEGDYIKFNRLGYQINTNYMIQDGKYNGTVTFNFTYCASRQQEQVVSSNLPSVMSALSLDGKSDEEKIRSIYAYVAKNVSYDWAHVNDDSYHLCHSTYAALINKTAVCQGYVTLFYRMALLAGVDNRVIPGISSGGRHVWNIVKIGSEYYNIDVTFDSSEENDISNWRYYLKSNADFPDHNRENAYATSSFTSKYPIASTSYDISSGGESTYRHLEWLTENGKSYWYENNARQGTSSDGKCFSYDGTLRGREIYDPASDGWYWLDVNANGAKAVGKEVFMPYIYQDEAGFSPDDINNVAALSGADASGNYEHAELAEQVKDAIQNGRGKWVRYDGNGKMLKGWVKIEGSLAAVYPNQAGNVYYYDRMTGLMAKGRTVINGTTYYFDEVTGVLK